MAGKQTRSNANRTLSARLSTRSVGVRRASQRAGYRGPEDLPASLRGTASDSGNSGNSGDSDLLGMLADTGAETRTAETLLRTLGATPLRPDQVGKPRQIDPAGLTKGGGVWIALAAQTGRQVDHAEVYPCRCEESRAKNYGRAECSRKWCECSGRPIKPNSAEDRQLPQDCCARTYNSVETLQYEQSELEIAKRTLQAQNAKKQAELYGPKENTDRSPTRTDATVIDDCDHASQLEDAPAINGLADTRAGQLAQRINQMNGKANNETQDLQDIHTTQNCRTTQMSTQIPHGTPNGNGFVRNTKTVSEGGLSPKRKKVGSHSKTDDICQISQHNGEAVAKRTDCCEVGQDGSEYAISAMGGSEAPGRTEAQLQETCNDGGNGSAAYPLNAQPYKTYLDRKEEYNEYLTEQLSTQLRTTYEDDLNAAKLRIKQNTCDCPTPWDNKSRNASSGIHCVDCHENFATAMAYDMHLDYVNAKTVRCKYPADIVDKSELGGSGKRLMKMAYSGEHMVWLMAGVATIR